MTFTEYAEKWNRDENNNFAVASYKMCSIDELKKASATRHYDITECNLWHMSPEEYWDAVKTALFEKLNDN